MKKIKIEYLFFVIFFLLTGILFLFCPLKETITCENFKCDIKTYSIFNSKTDSYLLNTKGKQKIDVIEKGRRYYSSIILHPISIVGYSSETQAKLFKEQLINNQGELLEVKHFERLGFTIAMFSYFSIMCIILKLCISRNKLLTQFFYSAIILILLRVLYILCI